GRTVAAHLCRRSGGSATDRVLPLSPGPSAELNRHRLADRHDLEPGHGKQLGEVRSVRILRCGTSKNPTPRIKTTAPRGCESLVDCSGPSRRDQPHDAADVRLVPLRGRPRRPASWASGPLSASETENPPKRSFSSSCGPA